MKAQGGAAPAISVVEALYQTTIWMVDGAVIPILRMTPTDLQRVDRILANDSTALRWMARKRFWEVPTSHQRMLWTGSARDWYETLPVVRKMRTTYQQGKHRYYQ